MAGLIPDGWLEEMDEAVTFQEYSSITTRLVELWDESRLDEWKEIVRLAAQSGDEMAREDGFLMLSYAWVLMGRSHDMVRFFVDEAVNPELVYWSMTDERSQAEQLSWDYPCFPNALDEVVYDIFGSNYMWGAVQVFPTVLSPASGKPVFEWDQEACLRLGEPLTREEAVLAIVRLADYCRIELGPGWHDYIPLAEAGTYDRSILTDELLNGESALPEVTQAFLPAAWKGAGIADRKYSALQYRHITESEIRFLAENGFNFTRLYYSFEVLRYPDYPEDVRMVNTAELKELDQILAWCIKYGVHLQIAMNSYLNVDGTAKEQNSVMPQNDEEWELTRDYWTMLARRYAGVPSKYLTFDLCNETTPRGDGELSYAEQGLSAVIDSIREADASRVLLYSFGANGNLKWAEICASLGIGIGCHAYPLTAITLAGNEHWNQNPYAQLCYEEANWPLPYFPTGQVSRGRARVTLTGAVDNASLGFHVQKSGAHPIVTIYANGEVLEKIPLEGGVSDEQNDYHYMQIGFSAQIPAGTEEIELEVSQDWAMIDTIVLERDGVKTVILPNDGDGVQDESSPLPLVVNGDGTYANSENSYFDEDRMYSLSVKPFHDIAKERGVGFMVNEFGMAGTRTYWNIDFVRAFHEMNLAMLSKYEIGWSYCEIANDFSKHLLILYGDHSQWSGSTTEEITYDFGDHTETIKVCKELLEVFRRHTLEQE